MINDDKISEIYIFLKPFLFSLILYYYDNDKHILQRNEDVFAAKRMRYDALWVRNVFGTSCLVTDTAFKLKVVKCVTESNNNFP